MAKIKITFSRQINRLKELQVDADVHIERAISSTNELLYIELVKLFLNSSISFLEERAKKLSFLTQKELSARFQHFQDDAKRLVAIGSSALQTIHRPKMVQIPRGTEGLISDLFQTLSSAQDIDFFINVSSSEDYSINVTEYRELLEYLEQSPLSASVPDRLKKRVAIINVFATQKNDSLRHAIFAHEVAHGLIAFDPQYANLKWDLRKELEKPILTSIATEISHYGVDEQSAIQQRYIGYYENWIEELACDLSG